MAAELWVRDAGGVARLLKELWIRDAGGVPRLIKELWARDGGGVARKIFQYFTVINVGLSDDIGGSADSPFFEFRSDGTLLSRAGTGNWGAPPATGVGANYWIRVDPDSGASPDFGTMGSWVSLSSVRVWNLNPAPPLGYRASFNTYKIATDAGGVNIVADNTLILISDRV